MKVDINDLQVVNSFYHDFRRLRYYKLIKLGFEMGADETFNEYEVLIYDYWVDYGSYVNYINGLNHDDMDNINSCFEDIKNDLMIHWM